MSDEKKFKAVAITAVGLVILTLAYNVFQDTFVAGIGDYAKRRLYYEQVISKKGLSLHKGMYWKEKE